MSTTQDVVRERYRARALQMADSGCCGGGGAGATRRAGGVDVSISLGCGNPMLLAELDPGETVLDLGSGGGLDVLLSARRVAPRGHAYGLDMTGEMLELARGDQAR